ncbi:MAG: type IV pilus modification protein PilV [Sterolibacterium sp.]|nr:type IV pilus modification protein PilV [Sterolibacterium sp.]
MKTPTSLRNQRGVSLLEVLIAMLILAFGLLGLIALQMATLRNNQSAFDRSRAVMAAYSVADIKRAEYLATGALSSPNSFPEDLQNNLKEHLGESAEGEIECEETTLTPAMGDGISRYTCTITITWDDSLGLQDKGNEDNAGRLTTQVQL